MCAPHMCLSVSDAVTLIGHWACKADRMARAYDGTKLFTERGYKASVAVNVRAGWRPVPEGDLLVRPFVPLGVALAASVQPVPSAPVASAAGFPGLVDGLLEQFKGGHYKLLGVRLSDDEGISCKAWRCGTKESPAKQAEFAASASRWSSDGSPAAFVSIVIAPRPSRGLAAD